MKLHHIGIASDNIKKSIERLRMIYDLKNVGEIIYDELQEVELCYIETTNGVNIELISGEKVKSFCKNLTPIYHLCYQVKNINEHIDEMIKIKGCLLISEPKPAKLFNNRLVAFIQSKEGMIELLEE